MPRLVLPAQHRHAFQSYDLFPHMTVFENTAYGLRVRGMAAAEIGDMVSSILGLLGLGDLA